MKGQFSLAAKRGDAKGAEAAARRAAEQATLMAWDAWHGSGYDMGTS